MSGPPVCLTIPPPHTHTHPSVWLDPSVPSLPSSSLLWWLHLSHLLRPTRLFLCLCVFVLTVDSTSSSPTRDRVLPLDPSVSSSSCSLRSASSLLSSCLHPSPTLLLYGVGGCVSPLVDGVQVVTAACPARQGRHCPPLLGGVLPGVVVAPGLAPPVLHQRASSQGQLTSLIPPPFFSHRQAD